LVINLKLFVFNLILKDLLLPLALWLFYLITINIGSNS